ncbi:MAG TPA: acetyl-CoA carboxylase carboxyl transferase subunit alpha, partial [Alcanivorax sp.]|nr:acetyl-CoA carboxylase carboxyl transferase subunit alpha [Alcanivorax sp.]
MNPNFLEFEQPIADLEAKIEELRLVGSGSEVNISEEVAKLQEKSISLPENIFSNLSAWQISQLARHPKRPYMLDYIKRIFADF